MMDDLLRFRLPAAEKAAFQAAATGRGLKLSDWVRRACREKLEDELGVTVGVGALQDEAMPHRNGDGDGDGNFSWD